MEQFVAPGIAKKSPKYVDFMFPSAKFVCRKPSQMHFGPHVTKNNEFFSHVIAPSKPSHYINYGLQKAQKIP